MSGHRRSIWKLIDEWKILLANGKFQIISEANKKDKDPEEEVSKSR